LRRERIEKKHNVDFVHFPIKMINEKFKSTMDFRVVTAMSSLYPMLDERMTDKSMNSSDFPNDIWETELKPRSDPSYPNA